MAILDFGDSKAALLYYVLLYGQSQIVSYGTAKIRAVLKTQKVRIRKIKKAQCIRMW